MPSIEKSHDTGLRIMEVFKILLNEDIGKISIIEKLKLNNEIGNAYTVEAYIKYFNTFDELGLTVKKTKDGYTLENALTRLNLNASEEKMLMKVIQAIPRLNNQDLEAEVKSFFKRFDKYVKPDLRKELKNIEKITYSNNVIMNIVNTLKNLMHQNTQATITFVRPRGSEVTYTNVSIKRIIEDKGHYFALVFNSSMQRCRRVCIDYINSIKESPMQAKNMESNNTVIYELYGRLSKSYKIKPWESMVNYGSGVLRISNTKEDYETLLPRLLKYGENCKIIRPNNVVDEFLELTNDVLNNLEETKCLK